MNLIFKNSNGRERVVATVDSEEQALKIICDFCDEKNLVIHYIRSWRYGNGKKFDYGSHDEFFYLENGE